MSYDTQKVINIVINEWKYNIIRAIDILYPMNNSIVSFTILYTSNMCDLNRFFFF